MDFRALFRRDTSSVEQPKDRAEKLLADSLRLLGAAFTKLAEAVESQRLSRSGYGEQGQFLKREDESGQPK
jgi:hypothetical protein